MDVLQSLELKKPIRVLDGVAKSPLPDWAAALIWVGAWCRQHQLSDKRLVVFGIVPSRDFAAAFAGVGALLAGAKLFKDSLSWPRFRSLPTGSAVHWARRGSDERFSGEIFGFEILDDTEFIKVKVLKPKSRARGGLIQSVSRNYFDEYMFRVEQPPAAATATLFDDAQSLFKCWQPDVSSQWIWADGAEGLVVTGISKFQEVATGLALATDAHDGVRLIDILCLGRNGEPKHAKLRISHPRGNLNGSYPLIILDGPEAFRVHEHLEQNANLLVLLSRTEYRDSIHNTVLALSSSAIDNVVDHFGDIPEAFPSSVEFSSYAIENG